MKPLLIFVLIAISGGLIKSGWLPLLFLTGGGIYWLIETDKKGGDSLFSWLFLLIILGGIAALVKMLFQ